MPQALVRASIMSLVGKRVKRTGHITKIWSNMCKDLGVPKNHPFLVIEDFLCPRKNKRVLRFNGVRGTWPQQYFNPVFTNPSKVTLESLL